MGLLLLGCSVQSSQVKEDSTAVVPTNVVLDQTENITEDMASATSNEVTDEMINNMKLDIWGSGDKENTGIYPYYYAGCVYDEEDYSKVTVYLTEINDDIKNVINEITEKKKSVDFKTAQYNLNQLIRFHLLVKNQYGGNLSKAIKTIDVKRITYAGLSVADNRYYIHIKDITDEEKKNLEELFKDYEGLEFVDASIVVVPAKT